MNIAKRSNAFILNGIPLVLITWSQLLNDAGINKNLQFHYSVRHLKINLNFTSVWTSPQPLTWWPSALLDSFLFPFHFAAQHKTYSTLIHLFIHCFLSMCVHDLQALCRHINRTAISHTDHTHSTFWCCNKLLASSSSDHARAIRG